MYILITTIMGMLSGVMVRYIGKKAAIMLAIGSVALGLLYSIVMFKQVCLENEIYLWEYEWLNVGPYNITIDVILDQLTVIMSIVVLGITIMVMIYSIGYMKGDPNIVKFISYLSFFCFCMLVYVTAGNFVQLFIGWEAVGLASYLLISFWSTRNATNQAGLKAVIVNRIGDVSLLLAIGIIGVIYKSFDFGIIFMNYPQIEQESKIALLGIMNIEATSVVALLLGIAGCAKSAQIFFHTWLPDAMEGPTPVSSLLHSATMVTAGVYLIIRCSPIFASENTVSYGLALVGIMTAVISGLIGANQYDLKKIIAYSTCSQLGFMFFGVGLGYYNYALFHLITHAIFKCLLFLCSGSVIHAMGDEQDIRKMGNLSQFLPITSLCMLIGTLSLIGFPMLSGYYSKEALLEVSLYTPSIGLVIFVFGVVSVYLTSFYGFRVLYFCFFNRNGNISKGVLPNITEPEVSMLAPMLILAILSIVSGYYLKEILTGPEGIIFLQNAIYISPSVVLFEYENIDSVFIQYLALIASIGGVISVIYYFSTYDFLKKSYGIKIIYLYTSKLRFSFDSIYNIVFSKSIFKIGYMQYKEVDRGLLEIYGPYRIYKLINVVITRGLRFFSYGYILHGVILICDNIVILLIIKTILIE